MRIVPESDAASVVLLGRLNPTIFQPQWFARHGLISSEDADEAEIEIIHREICKFSFGDRFSLTVESNRLVAEVKKPTFIAVADLLERTFREFLSHTPLYRMGINRQTHFSVGSEDVRDGIGKMLAPYEPWGEWGKTFEAAPPNRGGLRSMTMEQRGLDDRPSGHVQVKIEPSSQIENNTGIYMAINDDYGVEDKEKVEGSQDIMDFLHDRFDDSMRRAETIIDHIMSLKP